MQGIAVPDQLCDLRFRQFRVECPERAFDHDGQREKVCRRGKQPPALLLRRLAAGTGVTPTKCKCRSALSSARHLMAFPQNEPLC